MIYQRRSAYNLHVEELDRELIARGAQIPGKKLLEFEDKEGTPERKVLMAQIKELYSNTHSPNQSLSHISTRRLVEALIYKIQESKYIRGIWGEDSRMDFYEIMNKQIKKNTYSTAAICMKENLINTKEGFSALKVKNYGKTFNLCNSEPFSPQPIAAGRLWTGFLVKEDIISTAGHCANENNIKDMRIIFGFKMLGLSTPVTWIPNENIYKGVEIIGRVYNSGKGPDWALVKLDRNVVGQPIAKLSRKEISPEKPVYIIGYPVGLPLKYSPGATVSDITETCFSADLNVYCGSSGSPVFDSETHEVIGIVVRGDNRDFRYVENCWMSVIYSRNDKSPKEPQCTRVSEFIKYL